MKDPNDSGDDDNDRMNAGQWFLLVLLVLLNLVVVGALVMALTGRLAL